MKMSRRISGIAAAGFILGLTVSVQAADYAIQMNRALKVDDKCQVNETVKFSAKATIDINGQAKPPRDEHFDATLIGKLTVLGVNDTTGSATKVNFAVDKLTMDGKELYPAGTVITADKSDGKVNFTIDDKPVDPQNVEVLSQLIDVSDADDTITDDDISGTKDRQSIGGTWPVNSAMLAKKLAQEQLMVPAEAIKGTSKLTDVSTTNGTEMMTISNDTAAENFKADLPNGGTISDGNLKIHMVSTMPTSNSPLPSVADNTMELSMTVAAGPAISKVAVTRTVHAETTAVK